MATLDTIKDILQENLDIAPENVDEDSTFESSASIRSTWSSSFASSKSAWTLTSANPKVSRPWAISWNTWTTCNSKQLCDEDPAR